MERPQGSTREVTFRATLEINEKWASTMTQEEMVDYLEARLNSSLGFRGTIKKLKVLGNGRKSPVSRSAH